MKLAKMLLFFGLSFCVLGREDTLLWPELGPGKVDMGSYQSKYLGAPAIHLVVDRRQIHDFLVETKKPFLNFGISERFDWVAREEYYQKTLILDPLNQEHTIVQLALSPLAVINKSLIVVTKPSGAKVTFKNCLETRFDENQGAVIVKYPIPNLGRGDVVTIQYLCDFKRPTSLDFTYNSVLMQWDIPAEFVRFQVLFPSKWKYFVKPGDHGKNWAFTLVDENPVKQTKRSLLEVRQRNVPAYQVDPMGPKFKHVAAHFDFGLYPNPKTDTWSGLRQAVDGVDLGLDERVIHEFVDHDFSFVPAAQRPETVVNDLKGRFQVIFSRPQVQWKYLRKALVKDAETHSSKKELRAFYTRRVLENRELDPAEFCFLVLVILKNYQMEGHVIRVYDPDLGTFNPGLVSFNQFPYWGLVVKVENRDMIFFPFSEKPPCVGGLIPPELEGSIYITLGKSLQFYRRLPESSLEDNLCEIAQDVQVDVHGGLRISEEHLYRGIRAQNLRLQLATEGELNAKLVVRSLICAEIELVRNLQYELSNVEDWTKPLKIGVYYEFDHMVTKSGNRVILETGALLKDKRQQSKLDIDVARRIQPVAIDVNRSTMMNLTLSFPVAWRLMSELEDFTYENEVGHMKSSITQQPGHVKAGVSYSMRKGNYPRGKWGQFGELLTTKTFFDQDYLVFEVDN